MPAGGAVQKVGADAAQREAALRFLGRGELGAPIAEICRDDAFELALAHADG
jgi:hypothetical protein